MKTTKNPFLSIIIPTRNEFERLQYCLPSILSQSFQNFEVIVVDDPETNDNTKAYVDTLKDSRIIYFQHLPNLRVPAKRNLGAKKASGEFLYIIDADMEMPPNLLQSLYNQLNANNYEMMFVAERTPGEGWIARMKDLEKQVIQKEVSLTAARIYKLKIFNNYGGYNETLIANEEVELSDRMLTDKVKYGLSEASINHYETSDNNLLKHLIKKFKYGTTIQDYINTTTESKEIANQRIGSSRLIYFTSKITWQNPILGIQFICFKTLELSTLMLGFLYSKVIKVNTITTNK